MLLPPFISVSVSLSRTTEEPCKALSKVLSLGLRSQIEHHITCRYADQVLIGDEVLVEQNAKLTPARVINVLSVRMQGNYQSITVQPLDATPIFNNI